MVISLLMGAGFHLESVLTYKSFESSLPSLISPVSFKDVRMFWLSPLERPFLTMRNNTLSTRQRLVNASRRHIQIGKVTTCCSRTHMRGNMPACLCFLPRTVQGGGYLPLLLFVLPSVFNLYKSKFWNKLWVVLAWPTNRPPKSILCFLSQFFHLTFP